MIYAQDIECRLITECEDPFDCSYFWYAALSVFLFIGYGVGIPLTLFLQLRRANNNNQMGDTRFMQRFGWLYMRYNRDQYYWEMFVMTRKLLLIIAQSAFLGMGREQASVSMSILAFFFY